MKITSHAKPNESSAIADRLVAAAKELSAQVGRLKFPLPVTHAYNPLDYAWAAHEQYLRKFSGGKKRAVFLGMNPGPFGMAQTGVPFGEVAAVRDWMKIQTEIGRPAHEHPRRPVLGFGCPRSEVSGRRLWHLFAERFGTPGRFFSEYFVVNYCPLVFCDSAGRNLTPDKLPGQEAGKLFESCDLHLCRVLEILQPEWLVGVGGFAQARGGAPAKKLGVKLGKILHPSPASPAANRGWPQAATKQLVGLGIWG